MTQATEYRSDSRPPVIATEILRESIRSRCTQAPIGAFVTIAVTPMMAALLWGQVAGWRLLAWFIPLGLSMAWRVILARRIHRTLDTESDAGLAHADRWLRINSVSNQALCGAGIWIVAADSSDFVAFSVTLGITIFALGATTNLTSDYRTVRISVPLLMAQPIAFWFMTGMDGLIVALPLAGLLLVMLTLVRGTARVFAESIRMRFEKDRLLERVGSEKAAAARALEVAEEAMRARALFLAAASHDLRQPLYAISILSDTLAMEKLPGDGDEIVAKQREAIEVLRNLFDNLLDLSRFDAGEIRPATREIALADVLGPLCTEYGVLCQARGLKWRTELPDLWIRTDPELLIRLVGNLLSNAVRYTEKGSVSLTAQCISDRLTITVADTGVGISAADRERVFAEFVQLHNPGRDREKGVGLGLSIVKRISLLLDAGVALDSTPGHGTHATLQVPLADARAGEPPSRAIAAIETAVAPGMRVWIVEDDAMVRGALAAQFSAWGLDYAIVQSRAEVMELRDAQGEWPDAIILDDMLGSGEQGLELAIALSAFMPADRILLVTGNVDPERTRGLEASGFAVHRKPLGSQALSRWLAITSGQQSMTAAAGP